jgi:hypothetical protein
MNAATVGFDNVDLGAALRAACQDAAEEEGETQDGAWDHPAGFMKMPTPTLAASDPATGWR